MYITISARLIITSMHRNTKCKDFYAVDSSGITFFQYVLFSFLVSTSYTLLLPVYSETLWYSVRHFTSGMSAAVDGWLWYKKFKLRDNQQAAQETSMLIISTYRNEIG